jgi:hypothetical protein
MNKVNYPEPDHQIVVSNIHSNIGNSQLELGKYEAALKAHEKDLEISNEM